MADLSALDVTIDSLVEKHGSLRRLGVAYSRGRLTAAEERTIERVCRIDLVCFALLGLVDDRQSPAGAWKV